MKKLLFLLIMLFCSVVVWGAAPSFDLGSCYNPQTIASDDGSVSDLVIAENCSDYGQIDWTGTSLNLTALGTVLSSDVMIGDGWAYVDAVLRPDMDEQATITLKGLNYAYQPEILGDGIDCVNCTSITWDRRSGDLQFTVGGFSNYSVTGKQDFTVYSDDQAYLHGRVYDSIDLGSANYNDEFHCVVMIFETGEKRLIQTNPERKKAGSFFGSATSSESELPEILGYFKIVQGLGNVYYRDADIIAYTNFLKVIKCNSNSTELIYEEQITPVYREAFKSAPARGVWITESAPVAAFVIVFLLLVAAFIWFQFIKK